jgi:integrase
MKAPERIRMGGRGQGSLAKFEGSPNWVFCHRVHGREHRESSGTPDLKAARRFAKQKLDEAAADRQGFRAYLAPAARRVTVDELLDDLAADYRLRQIRSWKSFGAHLKPLRAHFGAWRAAAVTAEAVDAFIEDRLEASRAPATINRLTQVLGQAFRLALKRQKVLGVPAIRHLPEHNARQGFFERDDFERVVTALPAYLQDVARFGYLTGWRRGELLTLRWSDVDRAGGVIRLRPEASKNKTGRTIVLDPILDALMARREQARLLERGVADLVFHRDGRPIGDFRYAWGKACVAAGLAVTDPETGKVVPDRLFHDLRRTAVRNLVRSGVREHVAMAISGHKTRAMFDRYNIVSEDDLRAAQVAVGRRYDAPVRDAAAEP